MPLRQRCLIGLFCLAVSLSGQGTTTNVAFAQEVSQAPSVSMVTLQTMAGPGGQQMVVTPRGMVVPLPGCGVNSGTVQIYMGSQGGFWYVDKNNQNVDLTADVQRLQARISRISLPSAQMPQYAPSPYSQPQQQPTTVNNYGSYPANNGSGSSAASTAAVAGMAGLGAMAGAAIAGSTWNSVPYGTPYYYGAGAHPYYYGANGKPVYVNNSNKSVNVSGNNDTAYSNQLQKQQNWYSNQRQQNPDQYKQWQNQHATGNNPFVHQQAKFAPVAGEDRSNIGSDRRTFNSNGSQGRFAGGSGGRGLFKNVGGRRGR